MLRRSMTVSLSGRTAVALYLPYQCVAELRRSILSGKRGEGLN